MSYPILFSVEDPDAGLTSAIAGIAVAGKTVVGKVVEAWESQGLGVLSDAVKCRVYEEINGQYELMLEYPKTGRHYDEIGKDSIILVEVPREEKKQAFRVYEMEKTLRGTTEFTARHISYDLTGYPVKASSVTKYGIVNALNSLLTDAVVAPPFSFITNKVNTSTQFRVTDIGSIRSWLGGREGSILDKFGGEWHWDNYTCELLDRRGADNGYTIRYAKNLTSLRNVINNEKTYTGVVCVYADADGNTVASDVQSTGVGNLVNIFSVDVSAEYEFTPTVAQLNERAQAYIASAGLRNLDEMSITLSFVDNPDAMASVGLGDTVTIQCEDLDFTSRVVKSTWDVLLDRYVEMTVGKVVATLSDTIHSIENTADLTDTRNVLKVDSNGNVVLRPLNTDADLPQEETNPYRDYFDKLALRTINRLDLNSKKAVCLETFGEPTYDSVLREARWLDTMYLMLVYQANSSFTNVVHLYSQRKDTDAPNLLNIGFDKIRINGSSVTRLGEIISYIMQVDMEINGDVTLKKDLSDQHGNFTAEGNLSVGKDLDVTGDVSATGGLTVGGNIVNEQAFTYVSLISAGNSVIRKFPLSWSGIICMYRDSNAMAMYMVRIGSSGAVYVTPIVSDPELTVAPSGVNQFVRLYNNGSIDVKWYYIGKGGY